MVVEVWLVVLVEDGERFVDMVDVGKGGMEVLVGVVEEGGGEREGIGFGKLDEVLMVVGVVEVEDVVGEW